MMPMANRLPTGPGSRGGRWHDPEYRKAYQRAWRAALPTTESVRTSAEPGGGRGKLALSRLTS